MISNKLSAILLFLGAVHQVTSHMEMTSPPPRKSKHNKNYPEPEFDYSYTTPLGAEFPYPCRGYTKGPSSYDINAGENVSVQLDGTATHNGGHCQFSVSYNDRDWVVLRSVYGDCLTSGLSYDVPIPADAPSGPVTFAWGWVNRSGNREYYMNCADITIKNGKEGGSITGHVPTIANIDGYEIFPEGFANDYKQSEMESTLSKTISPSGSQDTPAGNDQKKPDSPAKEEPEKEELGKESEKEESGKEESEKEEPKKEESKKEEPKKEQPPLTQGVRPTKPKESGKPGKGECTNHGLQRCYQNNLQICLNGKILTQICPQGSSCKSYNGAFACLTF